MKITEKFLSLGKRARGQKGEDIFFNLDVKLIIIHWIGPYPGQAVTTPWNWWENGEDGKGVTASAHYIVKDDDVLQALPLNVVGWHSGDARSMSSIGIEVIPADAKGEFSEKTIQTLKDLIAYIRKTYPDAKLARHYDGTQKKDCPRYYTPVTGMVGEGGRVANPEGGDERWENLKKFLNG